jgi:hypothetical protein
MAKVWCLCRDREPQSAIREADCFPCLRIGQFLGEERGQRDAWWTLEAPSDIQSTGRDIGAIVTGTCMPFLGGLDSVNSVLAVADRPELRRFAAERLCYAALKHLAGERSEATEILCTMLADRRLESWHERVRGVLNRIGGQP